MADLGLPPSEVREMTVGEIWAIIWAKTRHSNKTEEVNAAMYQELLDLEEHAE